MVVIAAILLAELVLHKRFRRTVLSEETVFHGTLQNTLPALQFLPDGF